LRLTAVPPVQVTNEHDVADYNNAASFYKVNSYYSRWIHCVNT